MTKTTLSGWGSASRFDCDRKTHFKRIGLLHAASVFWGHDRRPDSAKGNLYVHGSRPGRAEDALYVRPFAWTCKESFARSNFREIRSIDLLAPKIWNHEPHP